MWTWKFHAFPYNPHMIKTSFTLVQSTALTHNVFELTYHCPALKEHTPKAGQYVLFQLAPGLNRAYSLSDFDENDLTFTLIIKRIDWGKWSPLICDAPIGTEYTGMLPLGHFTLRETENNKCFIGTGTGFAPLYFQMQSATRASLSQKMAFIFWVRERSDRFYEDEIAKIADRIADFSYVPYFSAETTITSSENTGYVTDWITAENIAPYQEFYICGSPAMVKDARSQLQSLGVDASAIFFEQY